MKRLMFLLMTLLALGGRTNAQGDSSPTSPETTVSGGAGSGATDATTASTAGFCTGLENGLYCASCQEAVSCSDGVESPLATCTYGEKACHQFSTLVANCDDVASVPDCVCTDDICDPYDPDSLNKCNEDGIYDVVECTGCSSGECGDPTDPGANSCDDAGAIISGWNPVAPACTHAFYCTSGGVQTTEKDCASGQYVNSDGDCQTAPPQPCDCSSQFCPDNTDCQQYYLCDNGVPIGDAIVCASGTYFNPSTSLCESEESVCSPLTKCAWSAVSNPSGGATTPVGGSTSAVGCGTSSGTVCSADTVGNYPYGSCTAHYCSCRNIGGGNYQFVEMDCPSGLVFNTDPTYPYCDEPGNEDTC